ncbi:alpha/beta fold hydrolase [Altererythrobacter sp. CAU 1778]
MHAFEDRSWTSEDGLELHYRDYAGPDDVPPLVCLPGLTRNARDFAPVVDRFMGVRRILCVDFRGRGASEYAKDAATYNPPQYARDVEALVEQAGLGPFVSVGTSLGGIVTALLAQEGKVALAGVLLNDVGPVVEPAGLERIKDYVGHGRSYPTWMHAARSLREQQDDVFPAYELSDWLDFAKRTMTVGGNGRIVFDYDMRIAEPLNQPGGESGGGDLWPAFEALGGRPVTLLRGAFSDLLSHATASEMQRRIQGLEVVEIAGTGHAPTLAEPLAQDALARLVEKAQ